MSRILSPKYLLVAICVLFLFTRLYKISEIPPSVYWDEASIGYNAYSIALTGKDEWGEFLPLHFRAFGEFKLPVYIYAVTIFVKIFGLNEFSIRLPSVLFSLGSVIIVYFLAKKLTNTTIIGILSSFFMATSPWLFIFSRTGYEAMAGLMFYLLAIYLYLSMFTTKNSWLLPLSFISFILSAYSYNSFRIIVPLTLFILFLAYFKDSLFLFKRAKLYYVSNKLVYYVSNKLVYLVISLILVILSILPIYKLYLYDAGVARFQTVSVSSIESLFKNYFSHFSLNFLMLGDENLRSQQDGFGQIFLPQLLLLPLGLIYIGRNLKNYLLILALILISIIPAVITKESPHALRSISLVPFLSILFAMGTIQLSKFLGIKFVEFGIVVILLLFFVNYFKSFINVYPYQSSKEWQYGYKRIYLDFKDQFPLYNRIIISDEYAQPYIFALFYLQYNPEKLDKEVVRNEISDWGFSTVSKFDEFEFGKVNRLLEKGSLSNSLIFATEEYKTPTLTPISSIKFLDGTTAFWVYKL